MAESFMRTLKQDEVDGRVYRDLAVATAAIGTLIDQIYNRQRLLSAMDELASATFEAQPPWPEAAAQQPPAAAATDCP
jgi:transposase InsO family protein